jgi:2,4-dienoyl-CoA reductase (NADPH2)
MKDSPSDAHSDGHPQYPHLLRLLDQIKGGSTWAEIVRLARGIERAGATITNTGIGWHEARVPTIATMVPRAAFAWVTKRLMGEVRIPLVTTNRINMPRVAEAVLAEGCADMVSMARPFLADPEWVNKAREGRVEEINTCIGCNQACLDQIFARRTVSCLVNPRACRETIKPFVRTDEKKRVAVVGGGQRSCRDSFRGDRGNRRAISPGQTNPGKG